jgi:hypothetical protein
MISMRSRGMLYIYYCPINAGQLCKQFQKVASTAGAVGIQTTARSRACVVIARDQMIRVNLIR